MLGLQLVIQTRHSADDSPATHSMADMLMSPPRLCNGAVHSNSLRENDGMQLMRSRNPRPLHGFFVADEQA